MSEIELERTYDVDGVRVVFRQHMLGAHSHSAEGDNLFYPGGSIIGSGKSFEQYTKDVIEAKPWISAKLI